MENRSPKNTYLSVGSSTLTYECGFGLPTLQSVAPSSGCDVKPVTVQYHHSDSCTSIFSTP